MKLHSRIVVGIRLEFPVAKATSTVANRLDAEEYRSEMANRFSTWNDVTGLTTAA